MRGEGSKREWKVRSDRLSIVGGPPVYTESEICGRREGGSIRRGSAVPRPSSAAFSRLSRSPPSPSPSSTLFSCNSPSTSSLFHPRTTRPFFLSLLHCFLSYLAPPFQSRLGPRPCRRDASLLFPPSLSPSKTSKKRTTAPFPHSPVRAVICGVRLPSRTRYSLRRLSAARVSLQDLRRTCEEIVSDPQVCNATGWIAAGNNSIVRSHRPGDSQSWWWPTLRPSFARGRISS